MQRTLRPSLKRNDLSIIMIRWSDYCWHCQRYDLLTFSGTFMGPFICRPSNGTNEAYKWNQAPISNKTYLLKKNANHSIYGGKTFSSFKVGQILVNKFGLSPTLYDHLVGLLNPGECQFWERINSWKGQRERAQSQGHFKQRTT